MCLDKGGGSCNKTLFCYCCCTKKNDRHLPMVPRCSRCDEKPIEWKCYHHEFSVTEEAMKDAAEELIPLTAYLDKFRRSVNKDTQLRLPENGEIEFEPAARESINYRPTCTQTRRAFTKDVDNDLRLRRLSCSGNLEVRRQRLKSGFEKERQAIALQLLLQHGTPSDKAKYSAIQATPCILHLERRVGLKQLDLVLADGFGNAERYLLPDSNEDSNPKAETLNYFKRFEKVVNTQIFGTVESEAHWRVPLASDGKLQPVALENELVRKIVNHLELLIDISYPTTEAAEDGVVPVKTKLKGG